MKRCPQCHRVYDREVSFCLEDGTPLADASETEAAGPRTVHLSSPTGPLVPKKTSPVLWVLLGLAAVAILVFVVIKISDSGGRRTQTTNAPRVAVSSTPSAPEGTSVPEDDPPPPSSSAATRIVVPETLELETEGWKAYPFSIGEAGGRVTGEYAARGGIADDMRVLIIADSELEPFRNKYPFKSYHDMGKTTGGRLNVTLPPGNYYLLIVNPSPWTSRRIRAPISLENN